jgi:hypothetical protein
MGAAAEAALKVATYLSNSRLCTPILPGEVQFINGSAVFCSAGAKARVLVRPIVALLKSGHMIFFCV